MYHTMVYDLFLFFNLMALQGKSVNYFVPPPPLERKKVISCKSEAQPKIKISYPSMSLKSF